MEVTSNDKFFRISAKRILLTYSQVEPGFELNNVLEQLQHKLGRFSYIISKENHNDGGTHFHVLLIHRKKFNIRQTYLLDLDVNGKVTHGNYKPVNNLDYAVHYTCKDKQYITNLENIQDGELLTAKEFIYQQVQLKGVDKALLEYSQTHKNNALAGLSVSAIKKHFNDIKKIETATQIDSVDTPFTLDDFKLTPALKKWIQNPKPTLILVGNSGVGKTQFLKTFAKEKCSKTLLVNHKEDFRRLDNTYDSILVDDANIDQLEETQFLSLIDNQVSKTLRVLYDTVFKKKGIVQMIAMNKKEFNKIDERLNEIRILRRVLFQHVEKPFILNVNVNIQNNLHLTNNLYKTENNTIDIKSVYENEQKIVEENIKQIQKCRSGLTN
jgi:hypothetical protein